MARLLPSLFESFEMEVLDTTELLTYAHDMAAFNFYEFFAGAGMARLGLGKKWECLFSNDWSEKKSRSYRENFPDDAVHCCRDIKMLSSKELPDKADLIWASFPCQDLSLAGAGAGLNGSRSGVFWPFWKIVEDLHREHRLPSVVVLENVVGTLSSHEGRDFTAIVQAMSRLGLRVGAVVIDAVEFLPQSRPRLFVIGVSKDAKLLSRIISTGPGKHWHPARLIEAQKRLPDALRKQWIWWNLPAPQRQSMEIAELLEADSEVAWHSADATQRLISMMSPLNLEKLRKAQVRGRRTIGTIYKRTRHGKQQAELRMDGISGCLRTPVGGSSRQIVLLVEGSKVRSRLLTVREAARLMGIPESYKLPKNYNEAYHLAGDGIAVPVVSFLERKLLRLLIENTHAPSLLLPKAARAVYA